VTDRDYAGTAISAHSPLGYNPINFGTTSWHTPTRGGALLAGSPVSPPARTSADVILSGTPNPRLLVNNRTLFPYTRPDGFDVGLGTGVTISGVRVQDNASGKWTTPDAYAGDVHDPMSQKSFMWNNNNPYTYSDPNGYCPCNPFDSPAVFKWMFNAFIVQPIETLKSKSASLPEKALAAAALFPPLKVEASAIGLAKSLASESQLANAVRGVGEAIAGAGSKKPIDDISRLVSQHGGQAGDWSKMSSSTYKAADGSTIETHWYKNTGTGENVEFKSKIKPASN
jgi:hypothetical protein